MLRFVAVALNVFTLQVSVGMEHDGHSRPAITFHESHQAARVIGVAMAQDHGMKLVALDVKHVHVVQHTIDGDTGVEQERVLVDRRHRCVTSIDTPCSARSCGPLCASLLRRWRLATGVLPISTSMVLSMMLRISTRSTLRVPVP